MIYKFIYSIKNNNDNLIILDEDIDIFQIEKELCKNLKNCYIYDNINKKLKDDNIGYIIYNNKLYIIVKQMVK